MGKLNPTELMTGQDGRLYFEWNGKNELFAECNTFQVTMNVAAVDKQPVGDNTVHSVPTGASYELSLTDMVIRDDTIMEPMLETIRKGRFPVFNFQGVCVKPDGQEQRYSFNKAVPAGTFDIMKVTPGEVIERTMTFRLNEVPKTISAIKSTYLNK